MAKKYKYVPSQNIKRLCDSITSISDRHSTWEVFEDWLAMSAISISNTVDWKHAEEREKQYMQIVKKYTKAEVDRIAACFATLIDVLQTEFETNGYSDVLGSVFHGLELHNKYHGQFFTPNHICEFMGLATFNGSDPNAAAQLKEQGFITALEPCVGSGGLVLGLCKAMDINKHNPQQELCVTCVDIDIKCVYMSYLQLSLLGIPAVIIHGNTLIVQEWSHWFTPAYVWGFWEARTRHKGKKYQTEPKLPEEKEKSAPNIKEDFALNLSEARNGQITFF
ncbi:MAG: N-6 DNA methylase [Eubacterium sp.]|nr:N-6 DNA methylase [Eubacterium sp.]